MLHLIESLTDKFFELIYQDPVRPNVPHVDPEVMSFTGGTALPGIEHMSIPSSRSFGINLSMKF